MTEQEFIQQTRQRLERLRSEQGQLHQQIAHDIGQMFSLRVALAILTGSLALGLGLSAGYQIGRR